MAHLVELAKKCLRCGKRASVELFNSANASQGCFCTSCGKRRLAEIERGEQAARPW